MREAMKLEKKLAPFAVATPVPYLTVFFHP